MTELSAEVGTVVAGHQNMRKSHVIVSAGNHEQRTFHGHAGLFLRQRDLKSGDVLGIQRQSAEGYEIVINPPDAHRHAGSDGDHEVSTGRTGVQLILVGAAWCACQDGLLGVPHSLPAFATGKAFTCYAVQATTQYASATGL